MVASQLHLVSSNGAPPRPRSNAGGGAGTSGDGLQLQDRSHLLRRTPRSTFFGEDEFEDGIRIRRARRVNASFSEIPPLARNGGR